MAVAYDARLRETLPRVREAIALAATRAGREVEGIRLVAVTKGHPVEAVRAARAAGLRDLGENRVDELADKVATVGREGVRWHMIGHVQGRKAAAAVELADLVHSVDTFKLAERLSRSAVEGGRTLRILVQVNTAGEEAKYGLPATRAEDVALAMAELPGLAVEGLMTMAPLTGDERVIAGTFGGLRELRDRLRSASGRIGTELSMGMSNDLGIAVREGSTMVRIGTALFGDRR